MLLRLLVGAVIGFSGVSLGADAPQEVTDAVAKIADSGSYTWSAVTSNVSDNTRTTEDGQTEKSGWTSLKMNFGDSTVRLVMKEGAGVVNAGDGWKSAGDLADQRRAAQSLSMMIRSFKPPLVIAKQLMAQAGDIKQDGDAWTAELNGDAAAGLLRGLPAFRSVRGMAGAKATISFHIQGGVLSRIEVRATGVAGRNGSVPFDRKFTVEFSNVGSTTVDVPDEAKRKLEE